MNPFEQMTADANKFFAQADEFVEKLKAKHIEVNHITTNQIIVVRSN